MFSDSLKNDFSVSHHNQNASDVALHTLRCNTWNLCPKLFCFSVTVFFYHSLYHFTNGKTFFSEFIVRIDILSLKRILVILEMLKQIFNLSTRENFTV